MSKVTRTIAIISAILFLVFLICAGRAKAEDPLDESDIIKAQPMHFFVMYGQTAAALMQRSGGANLVVSKDGTKIALLLPEEKSPTGVDVVDKGMVTFVVIAGPSAVRLRKEWNGNVLRYTEKDHMLVFLQVPEDTKI